MKTLLAPLFILLALSTFAKESELKRGCEFCLATTEIAEDLALNEAEFVFEIQALTENEKSLEIYYSIDSKNDRATLENGTFRVKTTPGKHIFQIWINLTYNELYSDSLEIGAQERSTYLVHPSTATMEIIVDKPVIYLYPETVQNFEISVDPVGAFTFTYPTYNNGWNGTMYPGGKLEIAGEQYRYLFWESKQNVQPINAQETEGFAVESANVTSFLETTLTAVGFTAEERTDFITFWAPRMIQHNQVFVHFHQDTDCDQFAALNITPTPDHQHRFYMSWGPLEGNLNPTPQELTPFTREGFTAIEWGGQETFIVNQIDL